MRRSGAVNVRPSVGQHRVEDWELNNFRNKDEEKRVGPSPGKVTNTLLPASLRTPATVHATACICRHTPRLHLSETLREALGSARTVLEKWGNKEYFLGPFARLDRASLQIQLFNGLVFSFYWVQVLRLKGP